MTAPAPASVSLLPLIIVRPQPGAERTRIAAQAAGLDVHVFPIFAIHALPWDPVPRDQVDAILLGSANAVREAGPDLEALRAMPAYCVGKATARAAEEAGLRIAAVGTGGLQELLGNLAPGHRRLLRLAGALHVPLHLPAGVTVETRIVYAAELLPMPPGLAALLERGAVVMLHSGDAARHFAALCREHDLDRSRISLAAIGPRALSWAGPGWAAMRSASSPNDSALLALAQSMCQDIQGQP